MSSAPTGSPDRLEELSDLELIRLLPPTKHEKYDDSYHSLSEQQRKEVKDRRESFIREPFRRALDALWLRHENNMRKVLRGKVLAPGSTLCPLQESSKEDFVAAVLARAYQAFLARVVCQEYKNFPGYVWELVQRMALDERKRLKGRFHEHEKDGSDEHDAHREHGEPEAESDATVPQKPILVSLPEGMPEPAAGGVNVAALDVRRVMEEYASESEENRVSARAVRKKWIEEWTWEELADELYPPELDRRPLGARTVNARGFVEKDEQGLKPRLFPLVEKKKSRG